MGLGSLLSFMALQTLALYAMTHPKVTIQNTHIFCSYLICTWICCLLVLFANKSLPLIESMGGIFIIAGFLVSTVTCAVMPHVNGTPYASHDFVWRDWVNDTGWSSNALVFSLGLLNAAFAVGAPDIPAHLAEEIPR
jgi:choline transport protein